ncbi:hypothetical protein HCJ94_28760 [Micromonospora sp. HSS6-12]|uniref:RNA polymerase sigma-70 region 4 domain-containing protein n=1 Tax=Micromonospora thermarum TaxID=2720024 RepID=A0ABX0ZIK9_9ACTN|nr:hypothetical protein [Micromonospora thermarum]
MIRTHFGLGEPAWTLHQIGGALGVTAERARRMRPAGWAGSAPGSHRAPSTHRVPARLSPPDREDQ